MISLVLFHCSTNSIKKINKNKLDKKQTDINLWCNKILISESGQIASKDGFDFLLLTNLIDSTTNAWNYILENYSVIGKYFRKKEKNAYILCIADYSLAFTTHIVFHLKKENGIWEVQNKRYYHGNYPCSWATTISGFGKIGNYFYIDICGTGSAVCRADRTIICNINKDIVLPYYHSFFDVESNIAEGYECEMEADGNTITGEYSMIISQDSIINWDALKFDRYNFEIVYDISDSCTLEIVNNQDFELYFQKLSMFYY